jgi:hypothetical protein
VKHRSWERMSWHVESLRLARGEDPASVVRQDRLERFLFSDRTESIFSRQGEGEHRRLGPPIRPPDAPCVYRAKRPPLDHVEITQWFDSAAETISARLVAEADVDEVLVRSQIEHRRHCYENDVCADIEQHHTWDVFAAVVHYRKAPGDRWALIVVENAYPKEPNGLARRLLQQLGAMRPSAGAAPPPPGRYPVVFAPDTAGVFWHEAVGHLVEADYLSPERERRLSKSVSIESLDVIDDPTRAAQGHYRFDDEGSMASRTPVVTAGALVGRLTDRKTAAYWGTRSTANGRYATAAIRPRMSNIVVRSAGVSPAVRPNGDHLVLRWPLRGHFDGRTVTIECWGGTLHAAGRSRPVGRTTIRGGPFELLASIEALGSTSTWQRFGALCNKGGSDALPVGVRTPAVRFRAVELV